MKVAVIGSGGREHALIWKLYQHPLVRQIYALPGNGGTQALAEAVPVLADDVAVLHRTILGIHPDLVIVGPEIALAKGIVDALQRENVPCFGPSARAARIESSKVFAKQLLARHNVPTAAFRVFDAFDDLQHFVRHEPELSGWVVKADGLAAGKGAYVCSSLQDVLEVAHALLVDLVLGEAGRTVVLERKLIGREASALFWCDGEHFVPLPPAQDYKRALDGDQGPNTGGMGSFSPAPHLTPALCAEVEQTIIAPTLRALAEEGSPFKGILYAGLMLTADGPQVIEFNCRFGDPETQVIMPVWTGDIIATMFACISDGLHKLDVSTKAARHAVCVVLAANGYPDTYEKNIPLKSVPDTSTAITFHAGTAVFNGQLVSTGGRVLNAVGVGDSMAVARASAYQLAAELTVPGLHFRKYIALS